ncbi:MAG: selenocysteine-specific translation elongation factor [Pseudomonadales bacterium]|nr:selenocysteine-specific translation elongation factor [Pseudomonadales bacterium]
MIVTLAGHVDHGKTTLVRLLTGTDTDRLAEERRRGLTIDLGFAYLTEGPRTLGFVDVPGHHRFIHNMVAGVAAHQFAMLVIAADDGPMPQSHEHLQILSLIGVRRGLVVLTKCDRVDAPRRAAARREVEALLAGTFLAGATIIETSGREDAGLAELRRALLGAADEYAVTRAARPFRMAIDRAFLLKGTGLVVTGTVHAGSIRVDDELFHFPSGVRGRVRSLRVQNLPGETAHAGDRAALNVTGLDAVAPARGDWVSAHQDAGHHHLVLELSVLDDFPRAIRPWLPVHVYHASSHTTARLALLERTGTGTRLADLDCADPLFAKHGDRIVIRDQGLDRTLGGGRVIDNRTRPRRRFAPTRVAAIRALTATDPATSLAALLDQDAVLLEDFRRIWDLAQTDLLKLCASLPATQRGEWLVRDAAWTEWTKALLEECQARHAADPALDGLQENAFGSAVPVRFRGELLRELVATGRLAQRAGRYRPPSHAVVLSKDEQALLERLRPLLDQPQPMSLGDAGRTLRIPLVTLQKALRPLVAKGAIVLVGDKRAYLPDAVRRLAQVAAALGATGPFTANAYRDATGIGRNLAIELLEYFDRRGFTRRNGDTRTVVGDADRLFGS